MRVDEGHAIFGVGFDFDGDVMLMASAAPGTQVAAAAPGSPSGSSRLRRQTIPLLHSLEDWIQALSTGVIGKYWPPRLSHLGSG
jgi:hypothetical protein